MHTRRRAPLRPSAIPNDGPSLTHVWLPIEKSGSTAASEHVATKSELARAGPGRAGRGHALPEWDVVPTGKLGIRIDNSGASFWGGSWDRPRRPPFEAALAQIMQELEFRHDTAVDRRAEEERQLIERMRQWEIAREKAVQALTDSHRTELPAGQVAKWPSGQGAKGPRGQGAEWREVAAIRDYAGELEQRALAEVDDDKRMATLEWVQWARDYADRIDPLQRPVRVPSPPEPTYSALQPFMGSWSAYGPESASRWCVPLATVRPRTGQRQSARRARCTRRRP